MGEKINEKYKDRLFSFIFGREGNKAWTLALYNAMNGTDYTDESAIEITTMSDTVYMGMKNDVSFIVSDMLSLYEQQSSYNPNMPVRQLMYLGRQYDRYIEETKQNIYGSKQMHLPVPQLVTFYNGDSDIEDKILNLSDSFEKNGEMSDVQVRVRMINIANNPDKDLLRACRPLGEYSWFVEKVKEKKRDKGVSLEEAVDETIDEMPEEFQIKEFLKKNRTEVKNMCLTEYNEAETMQRFKEEGREEGREEGIAEGAAIRDEQKITEMLQSGRSPEAISDFCGYPLKQVLSVRKKLQMENGDE